MLISLHEHFRVRATDWLLSAILFSWGLNILAMKPEVWSLPIYSGLASIAPQQTWSIYAIGLGLVRIGALFVNGAIQRSPHARMIGAFLAIFIWVQISLGLIASNASGDGVSIFPWLAFADAFNCYRAARDARESDHKAQQRRRSVARGAVLSERA